MENFIMQEKNIKNGIIYITTNLINGKKYIGKDSNNNPKYLGSGKILNLSIKKYGKENFSKEILEYCTQEQLNEKEIYWIEKFKAVEDPNFYNLSFGGEINVHLCKPVECYDLDGNYIKTYDSVKNAIKFLNLNIKSAAITKSALRTRDVAGGYQWKYPNSNKDIKQYKRYSNISTKIYYRKIYRYNNNGELLDIWNSTSNIVKELKFSRIQVNKSICLNSWTKYNGNMYRFSLYEILIKPYKRNGNKFSKIINTYDINNNLLFSGTSKDTGEFIKLDVCSIRRYRRENKIYYSKTFGQIKFVYN